METERQALIALITGANKGIGLEIARQLGAQGAVVLVGARDEGRGRRAAAALCAEGAKAHSIELDVTRPATIASAAARIERDFGRLDILVNNAGILIDDAPPSRIGLDVVRRTYETNVIGPLAVFQMMLPLLRASPAGRVVNVSSNLGSLSRSSDPDRGAGNTQLLAYGSSKSALNAITVHLAKELRGTGIKVNAAVPGHVATDLGGHDAPRTPQQGARIAVQLATLANDGPTGGLFDEEGAVPW
jgi:NAD(P)-dependent dehydrogenase (short-subunit alcohol dehydrogenase family)